jgi:hypothetical protein
VSRHLAACSSRRPRLPGTATGCLQCADMKSGSSDGDARRAQAARSSSVKPFANALATGAVLRSIRGCYDIPSSLFAWLPDHHSRPPPAAAARATRAGKLRRASRFLVESSRSPRARRACGCSGGGGKYARDSRCGDGVSRKQRTRALGLPHRYRRRMSLALAIRRRVVT